MTARLARAAALLAASAALAAATAACGSYDEAHNHNAPPPAYDIHAHWVRIQSPGNYHTIIRACVAKDGVYLNQGDGATTVVPNDPDCATGGQYGIPHS